MALDSKTAVQMIMEREGKLKTLEVQNDNMKEEVRKIKADFNSERTRFEDLAELVVALTHKIEGPVGSASSL